MDHRLWPRYLRPCRVDRIQQTQVLIAREDRRCPVEPALSNGVGCEGGQIDHTAFDRGAAARVEARQARAGDAEIAVCITVRRDAGIGHHERSLRLDRSAERFEDVPVELVDCREDPSGVSIGVGDHTRDTRGIELHRDRVGCAQHLGFGGVCAERSAGEGDRLLGRHDSSELIASSTSESASSTVSGTGCSVWRSNVTHCLRAWSAPRRCCIAVTSSCAAGVISALISPLLGALEDGRGFAPRSLLTADQIGIRAAVVHEFEREELQRNR